MRWLLEALLLPPPPLAAARPAVAVPPPSLCSRQALRQQPAVMAPLQLTQHRRHLLLLWQQPLHLLAAARPSQPTERQPFRRQWPPMASARPPQLLARLPHRR